MHPFENLPISSRASSFSSALSLHNKADERARYLEFSVMKIRTFLEYLSDRIRTVSFSHMLMGEKLLFVAFVLTLPRELKQVTVL